uniref:HTH CENPB-type domain-containing protein n=1 Tax=Ditylenchus dipsaci TaxID=166011 RepID=A0A915DY62_9BILA
MHNRFGFVASEEDLKKLRQFERGEQRCVDRQNQLRVLCDRLRQQVFDKMTRGIVLHDCDIQAMAIVINRELQIPRFSASLRWVQNFKSGSRIVSRHITRIVSRRNREDRVAIEENARQFVADIRLLQVSPEKMANADQSGFVKEMISGRSLAPTGVKDVERVVQIVASTTHSYTVMPTIYANGTLGKKLFVVLQEPSGSFPQRLNYAASNLSIHCHSSHIMTKDLMKTWLRECVFTNEMPDQLLLIVDSWTSFRDHQTIRSLVPEGKVVIMRNIPAGATSLIQPLD